MVELIISLGMLSQSKASLLAMPRVIKLKPLTAYAWVPGPGNFSGSWASILAQICFQKLRRLGWHLHAAFLHGMEQLDQAWH